MSAEPKFKIGDVVWAPSFDSYENYVTCPDCGGTGRLRITFHDDTQASIECRNCAAGYDPPTGRVRCWDRKANATRHVIGALEISTKEIRYRPDATENSWRNLDEAECFATYDEAMAAAQVKAREFDEEERAKIFQKEKDTRTWAWNASYHRREIKEAQRRLDYHTAKLNVAKVKAKEPADESNPLKVSP